MMNEENLTTHTRNHGKTNLLENFIHSGQQSWTFPVFENVPAEIIARIADFLNHQNRILFCQTCPKIHKIMEDQKKKSQLYCIKE